MNIFNWFFGNKTKTESEFKPTTKPRRVSVHFVHTPTVVHYAKSVKVFDNGSLSLYQENASYVNKNHPAAIAHYTQGSWVSYSIGKRCYSNNKG